MNIAFTILRVDGKKWVAAEVAATQDSILKGAECPQWGDLISPGAKNEEHCSSPVKEINFPSSSHMR